MSEATADTCVQLVTRRLAADGFAVAILSSSGKGEALAAELGGLGVTGSNQSQADLRRLVDGALERWGRIDVLVNSAGHGPRAPLLEISDEQWHTAVDGGVLGMVHCVRSALPLLRRAAWARIVNFSAQSTQRQSPNLVAYTAAKAMVTSVSKNLSQLLAPDEIMVNVVSPGSIASEALVGWAGTVGVDGTDPYALMAAIDKHFGHPAHLPRAGLPEEIGPVVAFLASRRNSYMTGANINVDGGSDFT